MESLPDLDTVLSTLNTGWTNLTDNAAVWAGVAQAKGAELVSTGSVMGGDLLSKAMMVDLPVPDTALLAAFALLVVATFLIAQQSKNKVRGEIEDLYQAELLLANRRAQQAKGELRRAELLIERERQKRRREASRAHQKTRRPTPKLVEPVSQTA
ncbi:hypothetical protein ACG74X_19145 [Marivita sp. S0852]|uniref:hypothetical protein n=1 Tax=Marivita sp. S0852 TaxID=3373893 RepID=UPI003981FB5A